MEQARIVTRVLPNIYQHLSLIDCSHTMFCWDLISVGFDQVNILLVRYMSCANVLYYKTLFTHSAFFGLHTLRRRMDRNLNETGRSRMVTKILLWKTPKIINQSLESF